MKLLKIIADLLFPEKCVLCGRVLEREEMDLCHRCRVHAPECPITNSKYPYLNKWVALWYYEDKVRESLLRFKFQGRQNYAQAYGRLLAMKLEKEEWTDMDILTWIPVSEKRRRKRGYDQVELIALALGEELGIRAQPTLRKIRDNPAQSGITGQAQRRANVLGVYAVTADGLEGKKILLLDDIVTTGSTAGECARVLLTAGAKEVNLAVIAAARQHKNGNG